jgi:hypothetical protein
LGLGLDVYGETVDHLKAGVVKVTSEVNDIPQTGTGIIVHLDENAAYILTASHVIEGDPQPHIYFYPQPNRSFSAKLVGMESDNPKGLAALLVEGPLPSDIHPLPFSSKPTVTGGETVTIIGFPVKARTQWAVSRGTIAGLEGTNFTFSGAADGGNSGGPLFIDDTVVGVITQKAGEFGFAFPSHFAKYALKGWGVKLPHHEEMETHPPSVASLPPNPSTNELNELDRIEREMRGSPARPPYPNIPSPSNRGFPDYSPSPRYDSPPPAPNMGNTSLLNSLTQDMSNPNYRAGWQAFQAGNLPLAQNFWMNAAEEGHTDAMFLVGFMLQQGWGGTFNPEEGLGMWELAASLGNPHAQQALQNYAQQLQALGYSGNPYYPDPSIQAAPFGQDPMQQRNQQYEQLQQIIEEYNSSAKDIIDSIGR